MKVFDANLEDLITMKELKYTAEIGCLSGKMSDRILTKSPFVELHLMIDPWVDYKNIGQENFKDKRLLDWTQIYWDEIYDRCCQEMQKHKGRYEIIRNSSTVGARFIKDNYLDCAIIDADHTFKPFLTDIITWIPKIKDNGLWISHDYSSDWPEIVDACNKVFGLENINRINGCYIFVQLTHELKKEFIDRAKKIVEDLEKGLL